MSTSLSVLVVEDDFLIRSCLVEFLQDSGIDVWEAESCAEAAREIAEAPVLHALVADLSLPDGDGMAMTHLARTRWPGLPVIYISGHGALRRNETSNDPSLDRFISKPYSLASILEAVEDMTAAPPR